MATTSTTSAHDAAIEIACLTTCGIGDRNMISGFDRRPSPLRESKPNIDCYCCMKPAQVYEIRYGYAKIYAWMLKRFHRTHTLELKIGFTELGSWTYIQSTPVEVYHISTSTNTVWLYHLDQFVSFVSCWLQQCDDNMYCFWIFIGTEPQKLTTTSSSTC